MSQVVYEIEDQDIIRSYVITDFGNYYAVDSRNTFDEGPETMVFAASTSKEGWRITSWADKYYRHYPNMELMFEGHKEIVANLESLGVR